MGGVFETGTPGAAAIRETVEVVEIVVERLDERSSIDAEREVAGREGCGLAVAEGQDRAVAEVEDGVGANLIQRSGDVGEILESKAGKGDRVAARRGLEIGDDV